MQVLFFLIEVLSVPIFIFLPARKITEWIMGFILFFAIGFYYATAIIQVLQDNQISLAWMVYFLSSYRGFILDHWPQFNGLFQVNDNFSPTFFPLLILWISGIVRFIVVRFVPNDKLREFTHEHWLYMSSFLIVFLIISNVCNWNFLITLLIFLFILIVIAAGLQRIFIDPIVLILGIIFHIGKGLLMIVKNIWTYMMYIALIAIDMAKFFNKIFKNIRHFYDHYVREPFIRLHERLNTIWEVGDIEINRQKQIITRILATKTLDELDKNEQYNSDPDDIFIEYSVAYLRFYELYEAKLNNKEVSTEEYENALSALNRRLADVLKEIPPTEDINNAINRYRHKEKRSLDDYITLAGKIHTFASEQL